MTEEVEKPKAKRMTPQHRWLALSKEERAALPPEVRAEMVAKVHAWQVKAAAKNALKKQRRIARAEVEAWEEYAERERKAKLARALAKLRRRT